MFLLDEGAPAVLLLRALGHLSGLFIAGQHNEAQRSPVPRQPDTGFKRGHSGVSKQQGSGFDNGDRHRPVIPAYKPPRVRLEVRKATLALERPSASDHHGTAVREVWVAMPQNDSGESVGAILASPGYPHRLARQQ